MKSLKIAALGVAAFGLAALPVAGVFAKSGDGIMKHQDELQISILPVCTLGTLDSDQKAMQYATKDTDNATSATEAVAANDTTDHANMNGTWTNGTSVNGSGVDGFRSDVLAYTMTPGTEKDLGTTIFTVRCNNTAGWSVTAANDEKLISAEENEIAYNESGNIATASYWKMAVAADTTTGTGITTIATPGTAVEGVIAATEAVGDLVNGEKFTVTYSAGLNINQEAGTYTGKVLYTLAQLDTAYAD